MAKGSSGGGKVEAAGREYSRFAILGMGIVLGAIWGTVMWAVLVHSGGVRNWAYFAMSMAMIGGGVAAIFGAMNVRKRGGRVGPRIGRRKG